MIEESLQMMENLLNGAVTAGLFKEAKHVTAVLSALEEINQAVGDIEAKDATIIKLTEELREWENKKIIWQHPI
jgi:hypothetical protein